MEKKDVYLLKVKKEVALQVFLLVVLAHLKTMETVIKILQRFHQWVLYQFVEHTKSLTTTVQWAQTLYFQCVKTELKQQLIGNNQPVCNQVKDQILFQEEFLETKIPTKTVSMVYQLTPVESIFRLIRGDRSRKLVNMLCLFKDKICTINKIILNLTMRVLLFLKKDKWELINNRL